VFWVVHDVGSGMQGRVASVFLVLQMQSPLTVAIGSLPFSQIFVPDFASRANNRALPKGPSDGS
jgi:hypothetical protein